MRALAHLLAAESAQALQDRASREEHLQQALEQGAARDAQETREGALMRAARWALEDREPEAAMAWLKGLPQGAARRTLALRIKLRAARLAQQTAEALETARLLAKHRAFSAGAARKASCAAWPSTCSTGPTTSRSCSARGPPWRPPKGQMPELAIHAAQRLTALGGDAHLARDWLLPVWERQDELGDSLKVKLVSALEAGLDSFDGAWLARIEAAQRGNPRDATLQYLAGMACMKRQLWGKAQQLMGQAAMGLQDAKLHRNAWRALALLAEERGDDETAAQAWKRAWHDARRQGGQAAESRSAAPRAAPQAARLLQRQAGLLERQLHVAQVALRFHQHQRAFVDRRSAADARAARAPAWARPPWRPGRRRSFPHRS